MQSAEKNTRIAQEQVNHFRKRIRAVLVTRARLFANHPGIMTLTFVTAAVWLLFGMWFKLFGMSPRHRLIVAAVTGEAAAGPLTMLIGAGETLMALWILSGGLPRACAALVQHTTSRSA